MSDILWQTFNDTYTNSIRKVSFNSSFNNYSDKVSFNLHSTIIVTNIFERWSITYSLKLWKIYDEQISHSLHNIHFTTFIKIWGWFFNKLSTHHASQTFNKLSTQIEWQIFHHNIYFNIHFILHLTIYETILHHNNWVTGISSIIHHILSQLFPNTSSQQLSDRLFNNSHHIM